MVADRRIGQYAEHAQQKDIQTAFSVFWCGRAAEIPAEAKKGGQQEQIDHRNQNRCRGQLPYTAQQAQQEKQQRNIICRAFSLFQLTDKTEQKNGYRSLHHLAHFGRYQNRCLRRGPVEEAQGEKHQRKQKDDTDAQVFDTDTHGYG